MKFLIYLIFINVLTYVLFAWDKKKARAGEWRIPEYVLFAGAWLGGCLGAYLAMKICHHKTQKKNFAYGIPGIFCCHILILLAILFMVVTGQATM